jgi:hypothetical protein
MEDELRNVPRPEIVEGPHRALLGQRLMDHMRGEERIHMFRAMSWRRKLAWACVLAVCAGGVAWAATELRAYLVRGESYPVTVQGKNGPETWTHSSGGTYTAGSQEEAQARHEAIMGAFAAGKYELVKVVPGDLTPVGIYKVTLPDGSTIQCGASIPPYSTPEQTAADLQEIQDQMDNGQGELIGVSEVGGDVMYWYRYQLSNGSVKATEFPPYLGNEDAVRQEVGQLMAEGKGELRWGPPKTPGDQYCYRVTLSDGRPMLYFTDKPAN